MRGNRFPPQLEAVAQELAPLWHHNEWLHACLMSAAQNDYTEREFLLLAVRELTKAHEQAKQVAIKAMQLTPNVYYIKEK